MPADSNGSIRVFKYMQIFLVPELRLPPPERTELTAPGHVHSDEPQSRDPANNRRAALRNTLNLYAHIPSCISINLFTEFTHDTINVNAHITIRIGI